jgi:CO dehydrogenase maturation factor
MKLGVVGKGGVGKTTVSALLALAHSRRGDRVVAVDTDSNPNLGMSLGLSLDEVEAIPPMPRAAIVGAGGDLETAELMEQYGRNTPAGVTLLSALRITEAGSGCTCAGHATVRSLLGQVLATDADTTIIDMEAGLEHLSRSGGTLAYADALVVVVEPTRKSVLTAARTKALAEELGIPRTVALGNKIRGQDDADFLASATDEASMPLLGTLPFEPAVGEADRSGSPLLDLADEFAASLDEFVTRLGGDPVAS